ncbi:hypothetical protein KFK09_012749 [Dendrobium nobile]|uniref:Uncharacterized protein n=1 Tax=Dendrobium nobile TaxID=94219 RepID=A0A8T3BI86_DENNO|nr:hypothetical protein KFK09_012749 [Dendrobium nobile]
MPIYGLCHSRKTINRALILHQSGGKGVYGCLSSSLFVVAARLRCFAEKLLFRFVALQEVCIDCTLCFFGSFVAVRHRSFDAFLSDRKLRHFDRKQERELAGCEG